MHRTVEIKRLFCRSAEVNGTKPKSLRCRRTKCLIYSKRAEQGKGSYSTLNSFIQVFSATILRPLTCAKSYATIADRKSANSKGAMNGKNKFKESCARRQKRQPIPERVSGDGSAPPRFLVAVNFAFRRLAEANRPLCSVTSPLPKKSLLCKSFSGALFYLIFQSFFSVACAWLRRAKRAALVYAKHTPRCQDCYTRSEE